MAPRTCSRSSASRRDGSRSVVCVCNFSDAVRSGYRVGLPHEGAWHELLNSDAPGYGGSGVGNGALVAEEREWNNQPWSVELTLPPLAVIWLSGGGPA